MENTNLVRYWENKYKQLQTITFVSTFVGTLLGLTVGSCHREKSDYEANAESTTFKKDNEQNKKYKNQEREYLKLLP